MRIRDILIVAVGVAACIFGWLQEGSLSVQPSFVVKVHDADALLHTTVKPIITDIDGDGVAEMLATPSRDHLAWYSTGVARRNFENVFVPLSAKKAISVGSDIVGLATGYLTLSAADDEGTATDEGHPTVVPHRRHTQHIAVVTDDYQLVLFDSTLTMQWSINIVPPHQATIILYHATVLVLPDRIYQNDMGTVVFSGKTSGANGTEQMLYLAVDGASGETRWRQTWDEYSPVNFHHNPSAPAKQDDDKTKKTNKKEDDSGAATSAVLDDMFIVTEGQIEERSNSRDWSFFRESLMAALPHGYHHPWDSFAQPHEFQHAKTRNKGERKRDEGHRSIAETKYKARKVAYDVDDVGTLGEWFGLTRRKNKHSPADAATQAKKHRHPNVVVFHTRHSIDAVHLYTGKRLARLSPLRQGTTYHDVDDDFRIDELSVQLGVREASDGKRRVDIIHDCLGVITSGAPTSREVVYNATICDTEGLLGGLKFVSRFIHGDVAHEEPQQDVIELVGSRNIASEKTRAVPPVVIQHHLAKGVGLFKLRRLGVFMVDSGLVTCLDPVAKRVAWRVETDAGFTPQQLDESEVSLVMHSEEEKENRLRRFPHLAPYSFHHHDPRVFSKREMYHRTDPFVLAVGDQSLVAISGRDGSIAAHVQLPEAPVAPVIVADFNGDGTNDILVVTASSYFGFVVSQRGSTTTIPLLMLLMVGLLGMLFVVREVTVQSGGVGDDELPSTLASAASRPRKVKRSTD